jgi:error-prone DNA polymerase
MGPRVKPEDDKPKEPEDPSKETEDQPTKLQNDATTKEGRKTERGARPHLRLGLRQVTGLKEAEMARLAERRGQGYRDLAALRRDAGVSQGALDRLARADAFGSLALDRRGALWHAIGLDRTGHEQDPPPLFAWAEGRAARAEPEIALPRMTLGQDVAEDYANLRLSLRAHPLALLRRFLPRRTLPARQLADIDDGRRVAVAGLTLVRQRPGTASGVIFITLEDETGVANLVVWPKTFERFRRVVLGAQLLEVQGPLQKEGLVIHVIAERLVDRSDLLRRLATTDPAFTSPLARADHAKSGSPPDPRDPFWRPRDLDHFRSHPHIYRGVLEPPEARSRAQPQPLDPRAAGFKSRDFH